MLAVQIAVAPRRCWLPEQGNLFEGPARVIKPSRVSVTGRVATEKSDKSHDAESSLEYDFLTLLEYDRRVDRFAAQPITIRWKDATGRHRYTPDVVAQYTDTAMHADPTLRLTLFEVKPREILKSDWKELKPKFRAAIAWTRERDYRFRIVTERDIRTPFLDNVRFLMMFRGKRMTRNPGLTAEIQWRIRETLYDLRRSTPRDLLNVITTVPHYQAEYIPWIWQLMNCNLIGCDLAKPLTMASEIWSLETRDTLGRGD